MITDKFTTRIEKQEEYLPKYRKQSNVVSNIRLLTIILSIYCTYMTLKLNYNVLYLCMSFSAYAAFIALVIWHRMIKNKMDFSKEIININKRYIARIDGNWIDFDDIGEEFIDKNHRYSSDLDIVGKESLFQLVNTTNTLNGRNSLAKLFLEPDYDEKEILLRQEAVKELESRLDLCQEMEYITGKYKDKLKNPQRLIDYAEDSNVVLKSKIAKKIIYALPLITVPISAAIIIFKMKEMYVLIAAIIVIQLLIWGIGVLKVNRILQSVDYLKYNLSTYVNILKLIEKQEFNAERLKAIKARLFDEKESSMNAIKELDKILERINLRYNGILYILLNAVLLWDFQCAFSVENWKEKHGHKIFGWLEAIGELESLMSLSVCMHINNEICFPTIDNLNLEVESKDLGHPLINSNDRVANDLEMKNNIFIISGSNMSGKTTFLRTIGINLVLAYSGAPVCAKEMRCSILNIFTSMRISDELKNGISTFYAELMRIKNIIDYSAEKRQMIFLIDEIFRGTNSLDRIIGAKNVLANLHEAGVVGALTTHDLELCALDKYKRIRNYHFSEYYKNNKIFFDYKIKIGKSTTTNAKYLMNIVGIKIIEE
ncbi:MutS-related protein [Clostridium thailandense]|uniref:MutS-related protein n=1 Tax=Clostridium thailandense TaxID=2794346 RepID=UPI0039895C33